MGWGWNSKSKERMKKGEQPRQKNRRSELKQADAETKQWMATELRKEERAEKYGHDGR